MFEQQTSIRAFVNKLAIFVTRAKTSDFGLFPHYKEFLATTDSKMSFPSVNRDGFRERGALGHLSFWGRTQV